MPHRMATAGLNPRVSRLKLAIVESGIPQSTLAARLRISPFRMSRIVRCHAAPTDDEQDRLAEILQQPRHKLFRVTA